MGGSWAGLDCAGEFASPWGGSNGLVCPTGVMPHCLDGFPHDLRLVSETFDGRDWEAAFAAETEKEKRGEGGIARFSKE